MTTPDATLQLIEDTLFEDGKIGILFTVQLGATPQELQLLLQTADFDEEGKTVRTTAAYVVRCIGVQEHRLSLGLFNRLILVDDHPLLWNHNTPYQEVYFKGNTDQLDALMLELNQLYGQYYGTLRSLAADINHMVPLGTLLGRGHGMLGEMPLPMAENVQKVLARYGYEVNFTPSEIEQSPYPSQLLVLDDSYIIANMFSADPLKPTN